MASSNYSCHPSGINLAFIRNSSDIKTSHKDSSGPVVSFIIVHCWTCNQVQKVTTMKQPSAKTDNLKVSMGIQKLGNYCNRSTGIWQRISIDKRVKQQMTIEIEKKWRSNLAEVERLRLHSHSLLPQAEKFLGPIRPDGPVDSLVLFQLNNVVLTLQHSFYNWTTFKYSVLFWRPRKRGWQR